MKGLEQDAELFPMVSVIVPAFNAAATVAATLDSVRQQAYKTLDIIVIDDGSTDATPEIVAAIAANDPRVRLIRQTNRGLVSARNAGIEAARGKFIAPVDADDLWHPEKIEAQLAAMRSADAGMAYCWYWSIDVEGRLVAGAYTAVEPEGDAYSELLLNSFIGASTPMFDAATLIRVGGYQEVGGGCADLECHLAVAARSPVVLVPRFLVGYRLTPGSMSQNPRVMLDSYTNVISRVRRDDPHLPVRLFRWSRAKTYFRLAQRTKGVKAIGLILRALAVDPLLPLTLPLRKVLVRRLGLPLQGDDRHLRGQPFLPPPPGLDAFIPAAPTFLERRRRQDAAAAARVSSRLHRCG